MSGEFNLAGKTELQKSNWFSRANRSSRGAKRTISWSFTLNSQPEVRLRLIFLATHLFSLQSLDPLIKTLLFSPPPPPLQDTSHLAKVLKEKSEYRPKSFITDPVTTHVSDRVDKLKDASVNWKNRVETKDAAKFTVAAKTTNHPVELPFKKSEVRCTLPMVEFQSSNSTPLGLAKSPSMIVSSNGTKQLHLPTPPAFLRSVSVPEQEENGGTHGGVKVTVPKLDEDKLFDKFFTKTRVTSDDSKSVAITEGDLDAVTTTTER